MGSIDVGGYDGCVVATVLLVVTLVHHVDHALGISIPRITRVRRAIVNHCLINGICRLVRENAGGQT